MSFDGLVSALEGVLSRDQAVTADETRPPTERETYGLYFCQPERSFRPSAYLAFYRENLIKEKVPR